MKSKDKRMYGEKDTVRKMVNTKKCQKEETLFQKHGFVCRIVSQKEKTSFEEVGNRGTKDGVREKSSKTYEKPQRTIFQRKFRGTFRIIWKGWGKKKAKKEAEREIKPFYDNKMIRNRLSSTNKIRVAFWRYILFFLFRCNFLISSSMPLQNAFIV